MVTRTLPRGFVVSHPTMDDVREAQALIALSEEVIEGLVETTLEDVKLWWQDPDFDIASDAWTVRSPAGMLVALASVMYEQHVRLYAGCDVHPEYLGQGIGSYLLHLSEARAVLHIPEAAPEARVAMLTRANMHDSQRIHLLEKHGFQHIRASWRMNIELSAVPSTPTWPEGLTLRTLAADRSMARAVYEADEEAFADHWGHMSHTYEEFERWTMQREQFDPTLWFLVMAGNEIAGLALCQDEKELGGWVHSLAVRRPWRRKGLGLALLYHAFGEFYRRGIHSVSLGVDAQNLTGATRLYERAGMHIVKQYNTYEKELRAGKELSTQSLES